MALSRDDCQVLRGLAITSISLHNYCHLLDGAIHENEYWFSNEYDSEFWQSLISSDILLQLFSYLGHLGVPVFVFLTGYGLTMKYDDAVGKMPVNMSSFVWSHYVKFFMPMLLGMLGFMLIHYLLNGSLWEGWPATFITQMTLSNNIVPHPDRLIVPGPYWYFGMTMQLYVFYRIMVYHRSIRLLSYCAILSVIVLSMLGTHHYALIWFKYNACGWLLPFAMGIVLGRWQPKLELTRWQWLCTSVVSGLIVLLFGGNYFLWLLIPPFAVFFFIGLCRCMPEGIYLMSCFLGNLSLYIFVIHPIVREVLLTLIPPAYQRLGTLVYMLVVLSVAYLLSLIVRRNDSLSSVNKQ